MNTKTIYTILITIIATFLISKGFANDLSVFTDGVGSKVEEVSNAGKLIGLGIGLIAIVFEFASSFLTERPIDKMKLFRYGMLAIMLTFAGTIFDWLSSGL